ncbi:glycosyltransferase [[Haemophilus] felis]|uniref:Glycosyl transferase n=1 Tax=[Haemophilus] felis TaxID=123822 RepID=A0A1T0B5I0_9PAST|nr:glycosyltransferase [[Haemophilus] felis]NBI41111.1 glycosyltransferase [[Haemophilus] felis]OOS05286.1 glycosyl transferase [[Haemophilus] felis]
MMSTLPISVTLLVKNAEKYLDACLSALQDFAEIIVLDNGSTDSTLDIATKFPNVKIHYHDFIGFGPMKNLAESLASNDWILNIDSDEILSQALVEELKSLDLSNKNKVYSFLRINHYRGKPIKTCGWYPDYVSRLYHRTLVKFNDKQVHESLVIPKRVDVVRLKHSFTHYSFDGATSLINKMQQYTSLFAEQQQFRKRTTVLSAVTHGVFSFIKHYFIKKGILSGADGFVISFANACGSYYKYVKLAEANQRLTTSLIITTYNRPDALEAVLHSVLYQTELPDEVIVADDGSTGETSAVIQRLQKDFPVPLIHSWQEDKGFMLAEARNRALAKVKKDYIVIVDGDMVLHPKFISDHKKAAKKGLFIQGSRVVLTEQKTQELLANGKTPRALKWYEKGLETRFEKRLSAIHFPLLTNFILNKEKQYKYQGIRGCNMAFFKEDAIAINGFNNDFVGWGREDSEFVARFFSHGGKRANIKFAAIAYHLWHNEAARDALPENDKLLKDAMEQKLTWCENGVDKFLE